MEKKTYGFDYTKTHLNYVSYYRNGSWDDGVLEEDDMIRISKMSTGLHYGQQAFEGMKAYRRADGRVQLFRPYDNARRFIMSCERSMMPAVPVEKFIEAITRTVRANIDFVPPHESKATLYIRPYIIGIGHNIGLKPSSEYLFGVVVLPVGTYFGPASKPVDFIVTEYDRAAPNGVGHVKVGGNYSASLYPQYHAKQKGYKDCIFLDPKTHTKIEEVGAANFFAVTKDGTYITPKSPSILKSITNDSLMYIARNMLKIKVEQTDIHIDQLDHISEAGACGTAAIITPVGTITRNEERIVLPYHDTMGPVTQKLYDNLIGIQFGDIEDPNDWIVIL